MKPQKSQQFEAEIFDLSPLGAGVGRLPDGSVVFVPYTLTGDIVLIEILESKRSYSWGRLLEIRKPSPQRRPAPCPFFGVCGGCAWQHVPYVFQFETKLLGIAQEMKRASIPWAIDDELERFPAQEEWNYRNRIQLVSHGDKWGYFQAGTHEKVAIDSCQIADPLLNAALVKADPPKIGEEVFLELSLPTQAQGGKVIARYLTPRERYQSFRQVHSKMNTVLKTWVATHVQRSGEVLDLFGGDGNLSRSTWDSVVHTTVVDLSIREEQHPAVSWVKADAPSWFLKESKKGASWDANHPLTLIIDPPRHGIGPVVSKIAERLSKRPDARLIMISCSANSLAKDLKAFLAKGFKVRSRAVFDFFPQTPHVELAVVLQSDAG